MERKKRHAKVNREDCVACGVCMLECRKQAIQISNGCFAYVNDELCVGCGICKKNCPAGAIEIEERN